MTATATPRSGAGGLIIGVLAFGAAMLCAASMPMMEAMDAPAAVAAPAQVAAVQPTAAPPPPIADGLPVLTVGELLNLPAPEAVNEHALQKHAEAAVIWSRYQGGDYVCLEVWRSLNCNRLLWLFTYADTPATGLQGGMLTTVSGVAVTAFVSRPGHWASVISSHAPGCSFEVMTRIGKCEGVAQ